MTEPEGRPHDEVGLEPGRYAYHGLERVFHEKARLGILTSLIAHPDGLLFNDLKEVCELTDGNLSRHLTVLHEEGLVEVWKQTRNRRSQTLCRLTHEGRRRFHDYLTVLEEVIRDASAEGAVENGSGAMPNPTRPRNPNGNAVPLPDGWKPA